MPWAGCDFMGHASLKECSASCLICATGQGNSAETLLFDTVHSGQLAVRRLKREPQPLLQLDMPFRPPLDPLPAGIGLDSELVKVGFVLGNKAIEHTMDSRVVPLLLPRRHDCSYGALRLTLRATTRAAVEG